jgi:Secretion system C-terminal sorting domain
VPLGTEIWHNGLYLAIPAYNGHDSSYAEASFESTTTSGVGNISNWLITPPVNVSNGDVVSFYTTSYGNSGFPDRLYLRLNSLNTTNVGATDSSVGDFSTILVSINPNLIADTSVYPEDYWGQFTGTVSGLSGPTNCRLAFHYSVPNGGGSGTNSTTIGVDAFSVDRITTGIYFPAPELALNIYPNPVQDRITIDFEQPLTGDGFVRIYNSLGQNVIAFNVFAGQKKSGFNVSNLAEGTYFMIMNVEESITRKVFVKSSN